MHAELPIVSFICAALVLVPLPWHWRAGTVPTISIVFWLFLVNIINGVNSTVWADNVTIVAPVWCDIATKIMIGSNTALPAAIFCLSVHLERVSSVRQARTSHTDKRRRQVIDGILCVGVPIIFMALHYIVQGHRFDIVEVFGCRPTIYVSVASIFIIWIPPLVFSVASCAFAALAFRHFWTSRINFATHLQGSGSVLTPSRYFRLMCMAVVEMFWGIAITSFNLWFTLRNGIRPWSGWADVHFEFTNIGLFPLFVIPAQQLTYTFLLWWTIPVSSIIFFVFFSFGQDAMIEYRKCISWVKRHVFRLPDGLPSNGGMTLLPSLRHGGKKTVPDPLRIEVSVSKSLSSPPSSFTSFEKPSNYPQLPYESNPDRLSDLVPEYSGHPSSVGSVDSFKHHSSHVV